ncbi:MAG: 1-(5-phosphoribosyl)-5-amino-4-imidazole-carboxylate carboxylase, partial [Magnetococcales bacterium]|nr:1-(5-phosphoribosyl)-5-amino-4-imidazole-carboxylate carboxylase [Magnetococcales bacterium]
MTPERMRALLVAVAEGRATVDETMGHLEGFPVELCHQAGSVVARLDTQRRMRHGFPEVVLAEGKRYDHLETIVERALSRDGALLITRVSRKRIGRLRARFPVLERAPGTGCLYRPGAERIAAEGLVGVLCAGTSDIPVAEEAALVARLMGARGETHYDAELAGLHRLWSAG